MYLMNMVIVMRVNPKLMKNHQRIINCCLFVEAFWSDQKKAVGVIYKLTSEKGNIQQEDKKCVWKIKADDDLKSDRSQGPWVSEEQQLGWAAWRVLMWVWWVGAWCGMPMLEMPASRGGEVRRWVAEVSSGGVSTVEAVFSFILERRQTFKNDRHKRVTSKNEEYSTLMKKIEFCNSRLNYSKCCQ